jgi:hypothetical protein
MSAKAPIVIRVSGGFESLLRHHIGPGEATATTAVGRHCPDICVQRRGADTSVVKNCVGKIVPTLGGTLRIVDLRALTDGAESSPACLACDSRPPSAVAVAAGWAVITRSVRAEGP